MMKHQKTLSILSLVTLMALAACGDRPGERALSGGAIGAGAGAIGGALVGAPAVGAAIGGAGGAAVGGLTHRDQIDLGNSPF